MDDLDRILRLAIKELEADDARLELGGREPGDDAIWCLLPDGQHRLVVIFDGELTHPPATLRDRLRLVASSFATSLDSVRPAPRPALDPRRSLDDALEVLAYQTSARDVLVIDETSPVIWGASDGERGPEDMHDAEQAAEALALASASNIDLPAVLLGGEVGRLPNELSRLVTDLLSAADGASRDRSAWQRRLRTFAAVTSLRSMITTGSTRWSVHDPDVAFLARGFGGIYWLVLVFEAPDFSELHAEAAMIHAAPWIERLVTSLPPVDPDGKGGRVLKMRHLRPV